MKKIFALGAIALFTLGSNNVEAQSRTLDCFDVADAAMTVYATFTNADLSNQDTYHTHWLVYYDACSSLN